MSGDSLKTLRNVKCPKCDQWVALEDGTTVGDELECGWCFHEWKLDADARDDFKPLGTATPSVPTDTPYPEAANFRELLRRRKYAIQAIAAVTSSKAAWYAHNPLGYAARGWSHTLEGLFEMTHGLMLQTIDFEADALSQPDREQLDDIHASLRVLMSGERGGIPGEVVDRALSAIAALAEPFPDPPQPGQTPEQTTKKGGGQCGS